MSGTLWINSKNPEHHSGYGKATRELVAALERRDIHITPTAPTVINFCMPKWYEYHDYSIGYTPWESSEIPKSWRDPMTKVDELWSTSDWSSNILAQEVYREVWTLPHGIDNNWKPFKHERPGIYMGDEKPFTFLHVGEPATRKGGEYVLEAWYKAFRNSNCRLIFKSAGVPQARVKDKSGSIIYSPPMLKNGEVINKIYSEVEMWRLFCDVECLVYPTRGEGFGFIPLEAMASGLPTIVTNGGATEDFANWAIPLNNYKWVHSRTNEHPGLWMEHDVDEIIECMKNVHRKYQDYANEAYGNAWHIKGRYHWDSVAQQLINRLDGRL